MKGLYAVVACLLLPWPVAAGEVQWRPAEKRSVSPPTGGPGVSLGRPVPARLVVSPQAPPITDPQVIPASFVGAASLPRRPVVRLQDADLPPPLPEPEWPADDPKPSEQPPKDGAVLSTPAVGTPPGPPTVPAPIPPPVATTAPPPVPAPSCCEPHCCMAPPPGRVPGRLYGGAEYLLWWIKDGSVPPLVTTSPVASQGIIGLPGTVVLFGGSDVDTDEFSGGRFTVGYWLDACRMRALEGTFFFLGQRDVNFAAGSEAFPLLARPFFAENLGTEFAQVVTDPNRATGGVRVELPSQLWGAEANLRRNVLLGCGYRLDLIAGFRYLDLDEGVHIMELGTLLPTVQPFGGSRFFVFDNFDTRNQFYGGQLGAETELRRGRWFVNFRGKVALGGTHQTIDILGGQVVAAPDGTRQRFRGGLLALPSNIGHFNRDHFAVVPEVGVNLGYHFTDSLRAYVGYTFLYWSDVLRPGDQIDRVLDINQIPNFIRGPAVAQVRPVVPFRSTDFWAQGLNFGLEFRY
ncbi:MAG TPA: BBP7 family outer membrane beta-barrel protein [Gemmataceae bacterium]|nr:BBP7 family outer membrane beta-barrel protein [Gemmataceae bacterium]